MQIADYDTEGEVSTVTRFGAFRCKLFFCALLMILTPAGSWAGGGLVIESDVCIIWIDFYSTHFTAYQPASSGNEQFCQDLPSTGETIFVLDYLHQSLKDVPVDFRIIRDVTGQGRFVKTKHVEALKDIEQHTVFYQPPVVRPDASLKIEHEFSKPGSYVGIVSAGHPTNDMTYTAVFPFDVGMSRRGYLVPLLIILAVLAVAGLGWYRRSATAAASTETQP
jgi:hypothetical protein